MVATESTPTDLALVRDHADVVRVCVRSAWLADRRDWSAFRDLFTDDVDLDYTSMHGGAPQRLSRNDLTDGWRTALGGLTATQHLVANHLVTADGDGADCTAAVHATHVLVVDDAPVTWTVGGHYRYVLERGEQGWLIRGLTMTAEWTTGDPTIMALAVQHTRPDDHQDLIEEWTPAAGG